MDRKTILQVCKLLVNTCPSEEKKNFCMIDIEGCLDCWIHELEKEFTK